MTNDPNEPRFYVVVCTSWHGAHGIYLDAKAAYERAKELSANSDHPCDYVPVPLVLELGTIDVIDTPDKNRGGYL